MKQHLFILLALCLLCTSCGGGGGSDDEPEISKDYISVTPSAEINWEGGTQDINISSNCNWSITKSSADWLSVNPTSGSNSQRISITAGKNETGSQRVGVLTIKGGNAPQRTVTVTQGASPESQVTRTMITDKKTLDFDYQGSSATFTITSNTTWTVTCPEWCSVTPASGSNNSSITVTAMANSSNESRTGTIEVKGEDVASISISVTQKGNSSSSQSEPSAGDNLPPNGQGDSGEQGGGGSGNGPGTVFGNTITVKAIDFGVSNGTAMGTQTLSDGTRLIFDGGSNTNAPKYYDAGTNIRMYPRNSIIITAEKNIEKVVFNCDEYQGTICNAGGDITASPGTLNVNEKVVTINSISSKNTTITNTSGGTGSESQIRILSIEITYEN